MIYKRIDEYFSALIFCNHPLLPITLRHHQPTKISHFMKHLIKLPFIALLLSVLCIASCSSDADLLDISETFTDQPFTTNNNDSCLEKTDRILYMHTIYPATDSTPKCIIKTPVKIIKLDDTRTSRVLRASNDTIKTTITED